MWGGGKEGERGGEKSRERGGKGGERGGVRKMNVQDRSIMNKIKILKYSTAFNNSKTFPNKQTDKQTNKQTNKKKKKKKNITLPKFESESKIEKYQPK